MTSAVPAKLPPPPRQVRRRAGWMGNNNNGCLMVFVAPFILIGIGMWVAIPLRLFVQSYGTPVVVTVDGGRATNSSSHGDNRRTYRIDFHYILGGQTHRDYQQVTSAEYNRMIKGSQVSGRVMHIGRWYVCISTVGNPNTNTKMMAFIATILVIFMALFITFNWGPAIRQRRLVRDGTAAAGTIVDRIKIRGKSVSYAISFVFKMPDGSEMINQVGVYPKAYESAKVGEPVTVLYDPLKPQRSVAYEYCNFEVVPMVG